MSKINFGNLLTLPDKGDKAIFNLLLILLISFKTFGEHLLFVLDTSRDNKGISEENHEGNK